MNVKLLTTEQKDSLLGNYFKKSHKFLPIIDANDNWVLGLDTVEQTINPDFQWVKDLPEIEFQIKIQDLNQILSEMALNQSNQ
jgi:hypothetical protein